MKPIFQQSPPLSGIIRGIFSVPLMVLLGLSLCSASLWAEPLVQMPKETGNWKIDVRSGEAAGPLAGSPVQGSQSSAPQQRQLKSIEVTLNGGIRRDQLEWSDGGKSELWRIGGVWIAKNSTGKDVMLHNIMGGGCVFDKWRAFESAQLEAFTRNASVKNVEYKGRPALAYEFKGAPMQPSGLGAPTVTEGSSAILITLWVDAETHYPIALKQPNLLYTFHFLDPSPVPLTPPQAYLDEMERYKHLSGVPVPR